MISTPFPVRFGLIAVLFLCLMSSISWAQKNDPRNDATTKAPSTKKISKNNKDIANNQGDRVIADSKSAAGRNQRAYYVADTRQRNKQGKEMANNQGDMPIRVSKMQPPKNEQTYTIDDSKQRQLTKEMSKYSGDMIAVGIDRKKEKDRARYQGELPNNFLAKRAKMREEQSREMGNYSGDISVKTLESRAKGIRKKSKKMANWEGDIIVHRKKEGMHPSSVYRGGFIKNSYKAKERYRQRMMKQNNKNSDKDSAQPNYMKKKRKDQRPTYDSREAEIWNLKQPK
jgi:hypothetical protein